MVITVGYLKRVFAELEKSVPNSDSIVLADLGLINKEFNPFDQMKRALLLKGNKNFYNQTYLAFNHQGAHYTGKGEQTDLRYVGYFDDFNFVIGDEKQPLSFNFKEVKTVKYKCNKCGATCECYEGEEPPVCTMYCEYSTSGICGGKYIKI